jgi:hypothetical protein
MDGQQLQFYVSHAGEQVGPFSIAEIIQQVKQKKIDASDYLYDETTQDWVMLMAYPALVEPLKSLKPSQLPTAAPVDRVTAIGTAVTEWFVLKGDNKFGPFSQVELVKMLQDKSVFEFDYVWNLNLKSWERIATLPDFSAEAVRKIKDSGEGPINEVFFRRRHARAQHGASILVHDNRKLYKGRSIEVSAGGAGIVIENSQLQTGEMLYLHFKPSDGVPPFNATCEIISKRSVNSSDKNAPVQYGIKFMKIETHTQQLLNEFAVKKVVAA